MKERIRARLWGTGAVAVGFAKAGEIDWEVHKTYKEWIGEGCHGEMGYLERHIPLRKHTDNVLAGAKSVISLAYNFNPSEFRDEKLPYISSYAYGDDYHDYLKERLRPVVSEFKEEFGGEWRICIDSAPVAERYWALKSGIGKRGLNCSVIIEGVGAMCYLVEILTTLDLGSDSPSDGICSRCGNCIKVCPTNALRGDGTMDARRCINYLTIEKRGEFSEEERKILQSGEGYLFGCDRCLRVCPHNQKEEAIQPVREEIIKLTPKELLEMEPGEFKKRFKGTPLNYAGLEKLRRNARTLLKNFATF